MKVTEEGTCALEETRRINQLQCVDFESCVTQTVKKVYKALVR